MNRLFSLVRRRPNYVDVVIPFQYGVDGYRLSWAANFDGSFAEVLTSTNVGFADGTINPNLIAPLSLGGATPGVAQSGRAVRIVFNPTTYSITDTSPFWLKFIPVTGGAPGTAGSPTLVLPASANHGIGIVTIHGSAPNEGSSATSLQLDLPGMQDIRIRNEHDTASLFVATEQSGSEQELKKDTFPQYQSLFGMQGSIWVRGGSATVPFSATFTAAVSR